MSKHLPSRSNVGWLLFLTLLAAALLANVARIAHGQTTQQPTQAPQQRPRRVGAPTDQTPPAKPSPNTNADGRSGPVEVGDDEVLRVDTQLVPVPVVVRD